MIPVFSCNFDVQTQIKQIAAWQINRQMKIDDALVNRLAELAKLEFDDASREEIKQDLSKILSLVEKLQELDTDNVEPLIYLTEETNVLRDDKAERNYPKEEALKNAPDKDSDYFKVPKVLKK
jgi:aspartyl-tRNA(Asn)/glutamyl-tRNA(Gln) amidotransferase subunit C